MGLGCAVCICVQNCQGFAIYSCCRAILGVVPERISSCLDAEEGIRQATKFCHSAAPSAVLVFRGYGCTRYLRIVHKSRRTEGAALVCSMPWSRAVPAGLGAVAGFMLSYVFIFNLVFPHPASPPLACPACSSAVPVPLLHLSMRQNPR